MSHSTMRPFKYTGLLLDPTARNYTVAGAGTQVVRIQPSIDCWITIASAAVTPTTGVGTNAMPITALQGERFFRVSAGDVISFICNDGVSSGFISIVEMTK